MKKKIDFKFWLGLLIPIIVSFVIYFISISKRELYIRQLYTYKICDLTALAESNIKVSQPLIDKVFITAIRIENTGTKSITPTDILKGKIVISLGNGVEVFDADVTKNYSNLNAVIRFNKDSLIVSPDLINADDVFEITIALKSAMTQNVNIKSVSRLVDGKIKIYKDKSSLDFPTKRKPKFFVRWGTNVDYIIIMFLLFFWMMFPQLFLSGPMQVITINPKYKRSFINYFIVFWALLLTLLLSSILTGA